MAEKTISKLWQKAFVENSTATAFAALAPQTTPLIDADGVKARPGIHSLEKTGSLVDSILVVQPFGADADNEDFQLKVTRWTTLWNDGNPIYVPSAPFIVLCTLGDIPAPGLGADNFLADTIVSVRGDATAKIISGANNEPAEFWIDLGGAEFIEFEVDKDAGSSEAASANALWRTLS